MGDDSELMWLRVTEDICARIRSGEPPVGGRIASQVKLAERHKASPGTIKRAVAYLQDIGVLEGRQGAGVFVRRVPSKADLQGARTIGERVAEIEARVTELERLLAEAPTREEFDELKAKLDYLYASLGIDASGATSATPTRTRRTGT